MSAAPRKAALAIDHGSRRTGFAAVDALRIVTTVLDAFRGPGNSAELYAHVAGLAEERDVGTFVVGWPLNMDGSRGARAAEVQAFVDELRRRHPQIALVRYDERLTTKAAEELLRESGRRGRRAREERDSFSALVLLRDWLASGEPPDAQPR